MPSLALAQVTIEPSIATELQSSLMAITAATLIPVGIISGIIGVGGLLLELVLVHFLAVSVFRGHGTI